VRITEKLLDGDVGAASALAELVEVPLRGGDRGRREAANHVES